MSLDPVLLVKLKNISIQWAKLKLHRLQFWPFSNVISHLEQRNVHLLKIWRHWFLILHPPWSSVRDAAQCLRWPIFLGGYQLLGFFSPHQLAFLWMFWFLYYTNDNRFRNLSKINQYMCVTEKRRKAYTIILFQITNPAMQIDLMFY